MTIALGLVLNLFLVSTTQFLVQDELRVAAIVDGHEISMGRLERFVMQRTGGRLLTPAANQIAQKEALNHLINRHIVFQKIMLTESKIGDSHVAIEMSKLTDRLAEVGKSIEVYLSENQLEKSELEYEFRWRLTWKRYLHKQLTESRLKSYFETYRRKFDGTKMRVAHILLADASSAIEKANAIKDEIGRGQIGWSEAAAQHSIATSSAKSGGDIGWINYTGPMVPEFCSAAMELKQGQISNPIKTKFGVHLIKCLEIKEGKIGPADARDQVRDDATRYLFDTIAKENRAKSNIRVLLKP